MPIDSGMCYCKSFAIRDRADQIEFSLSRTRGIEKTRVKFRENLSGRKTRMRPFSRQRRFDAGRLPTATIPLRNNIMPLYEAKNPTFLRRFADFDRTSETAENAKIGL